MFITGDSPKKKAIKKERREVAKKTLEPKRKEKPIVSSPTQPNFIYD
jgi:hypothetical protein